MPTADVAQVRQIVGAIHHAWMTRRFGMLPQYFDPDVVVYPPGMETRVEGREACVKSYSDFASGATIQDFSVAEAAIDVYGATAVAVCPFRIVYEKDGATFRESGKDALVFTKRNGAWRVVWRTVSATPDNQKHT
jgi:ketosteroid isomerase-like protein